MIRLYVRHVVWIKKQMYRYYVLWNDTTMFCEKLSKTFIFFIKVASVLRSLILTGVFTNIQDTYTKIPKFR